MNKSKQCKKRGYSSVGLYLPRVGLGASAKSLPTFVVIAIVAMHLTFGLSAAAFGQECQSSPPVCSFEAPVCPSVETCPAGCTRGLAEGCDPDLEHGQSATASCAPRCVGETLSCTATSSYSDQLLDVIRLEEAFDTVNETVRVPAVGNLPIIRVFDNAVCTSSGGVCNPVTGANCVFPCLIASGGTVYADPSTGIALAGSALTGRIQVADNEYVIQPGDLGSLGSQFTFIGTDLCTSCCATCPPSCDGYTASSSTPVSDCSGGPAESCDPSLGHGQSVIAECAPRCVGETLSCTAMSAYVDQLLDVIRLEEVFDTVRGTVRVPAVGNLPIIRVFDNAVCTNSGGICNPPTGANCAFPCLIGPGGDVYTDPTTGLTLPGPGLPGRVRVTDNQYVIQPGDVGNLTSQLTLISTDLCTSGCSNCPQTCDVHTASSVTPVPDCGDGDECTRDCCISGVPLQEMCAHPTNCIGTTCRDTSGNITVFPPISCDDANVCTVDACLNDTDPATACCESVEMPCPALTCQQNTTCDPILGCQYVDDCRNGPLETCCPDDGNSCTTEFCDQATGLCGSTPDCTTAGECDDSDICTTDTCEASCCVNTPMCLTEDDCDDNDGCTTDTCKAGCCVSTQSCTLSVVAAGCRYLSITPGPTTNSPTPIALRVSRTDIPCPPRYVALDSGIGRLIDDPLYLPCSQWSVLVADSELIPGGTYMVQTESDLCTSGGVSVTLPRWGDVIGSNGNMFDGIVDFYDISVIVDRFRSLPSAPPIERCDLHPTIPDQVVDFSDIAQDVDAFKGEPYPHVAPCP